jgi:glycine cleavage system H protein
MNIPENLKYTENHEWILVDDNTATIGITDFAQHELGDIVFVELPEIDSEYEKGDSFCVVESTKAASDVYAPLSGEVIEVNEDLEDNPEKINEDCYKEGWICRIELSDSDELDDLLDNDEYAKLIKE